MPETRAQIVAWFRTRNAETMTRQRKKTRAEAIRQREVDANEFKRNMHSIALKRTLHLRVRLGTFSFS
jgi:hypothetical protein